MAIEFWQNLVLVLHTSVQAMLKCISKQNLIKIDHVSYEYLQQLTTTGLIDAQQGLVVTYWIPAPRKC